MLKFHPVSSLCLVSGFALATWACSSGGVDDGGVVVVPTAGSGSTSAGSGSGGTGSPNPTAGSPSTAGNDSGQAGSQPSAGTGGMVGVSGGGAGGVSGGSGGAPAGGTGGASGGASAGSGGSGGSGGSSEAGKVVLYDGSDASFKGWKSLRNGGTNPWKNNPDGTMTVQTNTGDIQSNLTFQSAFFHIEYVTPKITSAGGGQERGNSGIYLKGSWEVQVLDTFGLAPAIDGCGAIYEVAKPLVVACNKEEIWNTFEIEFQAQVCTNGQQTAPAKVLEVKLNGMVVHQNVTLPANETRAGQKPSCEPKGLLLQDHSSILPVSYRNIWAIPRGE
jgi:Domain of Unknown Function (DUF1080)